MVLCAGVNEVVVVDEKPIWQRLSTDTDKSFDAFCKYRDLGADRSLEKVAQKYAKSIPVLKRWSAEKDWGNRVAAYDEWVANEHLREVVKRQVMVQTNEWTDYLAIRKGIEKRKKAFEATDWANPPSDQINALVSLMKEAADIGRRSVGLPEKITENKQKLSGSVTWEQVVSEARDEIDDQDPFA